MDNALLLSAGFEPLTVINWRRAVTLMVLEKVEVLEEYEREVRSPTTALRLPAVVKLHRWVRGTPHRVKFSRQNIFYRDNFTCQYCHKQHPSSQLTYDHLVPRSRGGKTTWTNIVTSCIRCNLRKGNKPLHAVGIHLLKLPEEPRWTPAIYPLINADHAPQVWKTYLNMAQGGR
ncbi:MAG: HNH endonuclease [Candidatus Lambdaproteobacteria bacterium]|nr:HNH endonuclease [Candidatus Lambdaproteobacteria bacterium]